MSIKIHVLTASKDIKLHAGALKLVAKSATTLVKKLLPIKDVDIVFYYNPGATFSEDEIGGIGGFTPNAHTVLISLNPKHANFKNSLKNQLLFTLVHELHHTIRWQKPVEGDTLLEAMIFEGLADHFVQEVTGRKRPSPWSLALTSEQKKVFLKKAREEWDKPTYDNNLWFFGSRPDVIPRWTGYTLGYDLVARYLNKNPDKKASSLVCEDATVFI